jgi:hypothetical protein
MMALESNRLLYSTCRSSCISQDSLHLLMKLKDSHFIDCSSASKSGIVDYIFKNKPKYLPLYELDNYQETNWNSLCN